MNPRILVPAIISAVIAAALLGVGFWAKSSAPEGANASTALIVNGGAAGILILLALAAAFMQSNARNIFAISAIICLVLSGLIGGRIYPATKNQERYLKAKEQWDRAILEKKRPDSPAAKIAFLKEADPEGNGQSDDRQYLINALMASTAVSVVGCILLFATRPKVD